MSEKTEQPSSKRLREARKKGQIVKSMEVTSAVQLACMAGLLYFFADRWLEDMRMLIEQMLLHLRHVDDAAIREVMVLSAITFAKTLLLIVAIVGGGTLAAQVAQVGFTISFGIFANAGQRLNVVNNFKQMFSVQSLFELIKSLIKLAVVAIIFVLLMTDKLSNMQFIAQCGVKCAIPLASSLIFKLFIGLLCAYLFFSIADYAFQHRRVIKQLMMTKEEVKQEFKDAEGNQEIKQHRKEVHRSLQQSNTRAAVKKSSFIVRNPTHFAVCMYFDAKKASLPQVLEKASGAKALEIIRFADMEGVCIVENIPLARALFKKIPAGGYITEEFFSDVAAIIQFVNEQNPA
jgi:type III secretion protein U